MIKDEILKKIEGKIVISSQAAKNEPLYNEIAMSALIDTIVILGKIDTLRLAGERDVKNTKEKYGKKVTVIGITKPDTIPDNYKELVYITPDTNSALKIAKAGADIVAFDSTVRNKFAKEIVEVIHNEGKLAMGDIADFEDAKYAYSSGCDILSTTLSGYTKETENMPDVPDFNLLEKIKKELKCPVILEGKISDENDVKKAFQLGATAVVIGSMVTRPHKIIEKFKKGLKND